MKHWTATACALLLGLLGNAPPAPAAQSVTIATDATFPPFESIDASGQLVGFDIDLMRAICARAALDCQLVAASWDGMFASLIAGKYDALISQLTVTDQRRQVVAFSDIYDHPTFRFVAKQGADIAITPAGVRGKSIAVQSGTPMDAYVSRHLAGATIKRYTSGSTPFLELTSGRADLVLSYQAQIVHNFLQKPEGQTYALIGPEMTGQDAPEFGEGVAIAVNKKNPRLLAAINAGLAQVRADGTLAALMRQYFGAP